MASKRKGKMNMLDWITMILLIIGGINWGLVGFGFNLVEFIAGDGMIAKLIYWAVGLSGLYALWTFVKLVQKN